MTVHISPSVFAAWMCGRWLSDINSWCRRNRIRCGDQSRCVSVRLHGAAAEQKRKSVLHAHGGAHLVEGFLGDRVRTLVAVMQDVADHVHVLGQLGAALAVRGQELVD